MEDERLDRVFKALAHPERRRILAALQRRGGQSLFELCASAYASSGAPLARQTVSQHLDALEAAGLVTTSWKGRTKSHDVDLEPLRLATEVAILPYLEEGVP